MFSPASLLLKPTVIHIHLTLLSLVKLQPRVLKPTHSFSPPTVQKKYCYKIESQKTICISNWQRNLICAETCSNLRTIKEYTNSIYKGGIANSANDINWSKSLDGWNEPKWNLLWCQTYNLGHKAMVSVCTHSKCWNNIWGKGVTGPVRLDFSQNCCPTNSTI